MDSTLSARMAFMNVSIFSALGRLAGASCSLALSLSTLTLRADDWPADIRFASCECATLDDDAPACGCAADSSCGCAMSAGCDCGYCFNCPVSEEFMNRMTALAGRMEVVRRDLCARRHAVLPGRDQRRAGTRIRIRRQGRSVSHSRQLQARPVAGNDHDHARRNPLRRRCQPGSRRLRARQRRHALPERGRT